VVSLSLNELSPTHFTEEPQTIPFSLNNVMKSNSYKEPKPSSKEINFIYLVNEYGNNREEIIYNKVNNLTDSDMIRINQECEENISEISNYKRYKHDDSQANSNHVEWAQKSYRVENIVRKILKERQIKSSFSQATGVILS